MESGLEDRNNHGAFRELRAGREVVSMESGLEDRNNLPVEGIDTTVITSQWSPA